jgi:L-amino acid N-acyltransferase YncA
LYDALLTALRADGVHLVVAVVALPNDASVALHKQFGFTSVGVLHEVGRKFGRWIDTELFELRLD